MLLKLFLYKSFFFVFIFFIYHNFAFGWSIKNNNVFIYNKKNSNDFIKENNEKKSFLFNKNECFSFLQFNKNIFPKKHEITILNSSFIGFWKKNRFKIFYVVKANDTLYSIAKNCGRNYYELSKFNFIKKPYKILIGQKIWIGDIFIHENEKNCSITLTNKKNTISCKDVFDNPLKIKKFLKETVQYSTKKICFFCNKKNQKNDFIFRKEHFIFSQNWNWPVKSSHIQYIYHSKSKNKEIEFFGFKGQPVFSAASGKVIFITDEFKKYGRLIILKHKKNYLSIYAFNNSILVKQQDQVGANQQISTMGLSEKNSAQLYFEIRYKGQSINPLDVLPKINTKKVIY